MWLNLKFPNYSWTSEITVVKQSAASFIGIFFGMMNGAIPIIVLIFCPQWNEAVVTLAFTLVEGIGAGLLWACVRRMSF